MADFDLLPFGAALAADILSCCNLPGGNTLSAFASAYLAKRRKAAAEILIVEISSGHHGPIEFEEHDIDPLIEMVLRFAKAVSEGAARENLILLAQVIAGLKRNKAFDTDRFRRWCRILEHLSRDELLTIGLAYRTQQQLADDPEKIDKFDNEIRVAMKNAGYLPEEMEALITAVGSFGLLTAASAYGGLAYQPTPWLSELGGLADLEMARGNS